LGGAALRYRLQVRVALFVWMLIACTDVPVAAPPQHRSNGGLAQLEAARDLDGVVVGKSAARATVIFVFASWCGNCHHELAVLDQLRPGHAGMRVLGVNYRGHEEYDGRGNAAAVRRYVAANAPWLRVVPADERLFDVLGRPPKIPTMFIYDRNGMLVETYDRRDRTLPDAAELRDLLRRIGA